MGQKVVFFQIYSLMHAQFMAAHTFDAFFIINLFRINIYCFYGTAFNTYIAVLALFHVDFWPCFKEINNLD